MKTCPDCNGDGVLEKGTDEEHQCPTCGGSGFVPDDDDDDHEEVIKTVSRWSASAYPGEYLPESYRGGQHERASSKSAD